jgi:hypothetical protein
MSQYGAVTWFVGHLRTLYQTQMLFSIERKEAMMTYDEFERKIETYKKFCEEQIAYFDTTQTAQKKRKKEKIEGIQGQKDSKAIS